MAHAQVQCNNPSDFSFSTKEIHVGFSALASSFPYILSASSKRFKPSTLEFMIISNKIDKFVQTDSYSYKEFDKNCATLINQYQSKTYDNFSTLNIQSNIFSSKTVNHSLNGNNKPFAVFSAP